MSAVCNLCDGTEFRVLDTAADGVRVVECVRCRLIFLNPFPEFESAVHYDADYYRPWLENRLVSVPHYGGSGPTSSRGSPASVASSMWDAVTGRSSERQWKEVGG